MNIQKLLDLAEKILADYEVYVDNAHDNSCGAYPRCVHCEKWEDVTKLRGMLVALKA